MNMVLDYILDDVRISDVWVSDMFGKLLLCIGFLLAHPCMFVVVVFTCDDHMTGVILEYSDIADDIDLDSQ